LTKYLDPGTDLRPESVDDSMMWRYRGAADFAGGAKLLRQEEIEFAGAKIDCYVISVSVNGGGVLITWWIEKKRSRIVREETAASRAVFTTIKLGESLPDDLFKFEPPPGAKKNQFLGRP
jgi:outer membrane lipoprotein-sorting protein